MLMQYTIKRVYYGRCANGKIQAGIKKKKKNKNNYLSIKIKKKE